jgi:Tol biopolymer transport system component
MRGRRFDAFMLALCAILIVGGHILVWADNNGLVPGNELFSIWALPLYVGAGLSGYVLLLWRVGRRAPAARPEIPPDAEEAPVGLPPSYELSFVGAALFFVAIVAELAWRAVGGGLPGGPESVLSPSRIALFAAALLLLSGPLISVASRTRAEGARHSPRDSLLISVGLGLALSVVTLLTGFVHPFVIEAGAKTKAADAKVQTTTDLYRIPLDGSGATRLTVTPADYEAHPDVSADGTRIAFARGAPDDYRVYTMFLNGSSANRLTSVNSHEDWPRWIPAAPTISYISALTTTGTSAAATARPAPAPGPEGAAPPVDLNGLAIWTVGSAGGPPLMASSHGGEGIESWAADGHTFCGWSYSSGSFDVITGDYSAGSRTTVASGPAQEWACTLSPDGSRIAFNSDRDGDFEIYSMARDGSDLRQLTDDPGIDQLPRYSPDGTRLAFISSRTGEFELYVGNATDLSELRDVSNDPAIDDGFLGIAWLPDSSGLIVASSGRTYQAPTSDQTIPLGVASLVLQAMLLALVMVLTFRVDPQTIGLATVIGVINGLLLGLVGGAPWFALVPIAAGLAVDAAASRYHQLRGVSLSLLVAVVSSTVFVVGYFVTLFFVTGIGWGLDLVLGSSILAIFLAAALGTLASDTGGPEDAATIA